MAETLFDRAIEEDPTCIPPYVCLGILKYRDRKDYPEAIDWFVRALKRSSTSEGEKEMRRLAYYHLGRIYSLSLNYELARQALRKAVEIDPNYADAWYDLGDVQYREALMLGAEATLEDRRARFRGAVKTWEEGHQNLRQYRRSLVLMSRGALPTGGLPFSRRQHNMSLRDLKVELRQLEARFANRLAQAHMALGEREVALTWIERAVDSPSPDAGFYETHARILSSLGRDDEAKAVRERVDEPRRPRQQPPG